LGQINGTLALLREARADNGGGLLLFLDPARSLHKKC
jgi:hypothetical protein